MDRSRGIRQGENRPAELNRWQRMLAMTFQSAVMTVIVVLSAGVAAIADPPGTPPASFTKKPTATKVGDKLKIDFAVDRATDVAVYIEDAGGKIVRHLVAGVLGNNPPEPLKANSLEQSLEWDGADDDAKPAPAAAGPFQVRIGLGLNVTYAGQAFTEKDRTGPNRLERVMGMATGPDGKLYVLDFCNGWLYWNTAKLLVFRHDGAYEKTIKPFPSNLPLDKAKAAGAFINSFGGFNPLIHRPLGFSFYPAEDLPHQPAITADGQVVLAVIPDGAAWGSVPQLAVLDRDGGIPNSAYAGPALGPGLHYTAYPFLAAASDSRSVYISGLGPNKEKSNPAIYCSKLSGSPGPAEVWFGETGQSGNDDAHLNNPRGLAVDGKGRLLVADFGNNRVLALTEKDKHSAGSFPVQAPNWLAIHPKSGAVYVQSGATVIKFSGLDKAAELARVELPKPSGKSDPWRLALDVSAEPTVLWAASGAKLLRFEENADSKFSAAKPADCFPTELFWRPAASSNRREILCKIGSGTYTYKVSILDEETGQLRNVDSSVGGSEGRNHRLGPDGAIYAQDHAFGAGGIFRYDRDGKPKPFEATLTDPYLKGRLPVGFTGTTMWERDFSVDRHGDIYVRAAGPEYHGLMSVHVYDQQGVLKRIVLQTVSDAMYGPRVDPKGNLYIMDSIRPKDEPFPAEFTAQLTGDRKGVATWYNWIYGSVIKFGPPGGAIWYSGNQASPLTYEGWGADASVSGLHTTGGCLTGTVVKKSALLNFPSVRLDAAVQNKLVMRLKNDSDGTQAVVHYHNLGSEGYVESCGPGKAKTVDIKPNSDFTEYTFDLAGEKDWKGAIWRMTLSPTNAAKGTFSIDWIRIGDGDAKLVWNFDAEDGPDKKLPADLKKEQVGAYNRPPGTVLQGALWWKPGFSPVGETGGSDRCHCTGSDFDVDDFGRVFAPDTGRFRVGVLDTNGNEILSFGGYGTQDNCGPDSYVLDPAGKFLRPRKDSDPQGLVSPFAKPDIGLAWIVGLAVTDRYAYVDDVINKRMLRVKLAYTVQETCQAR